MKDKIITIIFCFVFIGFFIVNLLHTDVNISISERRKLAQLPNWNWQEVMDGKYMKQFDSYTSDQIVARDSLRSIKTKLEFTLFSKKDVHQLYVNNDGIYSRNEPLNDTSITYISNKIQQQAKNFTGDKNIYFSIIPDKSYFLEDEFTFLDTDLLVDKMKSQLATYAYIDIFPLLDSSDYFFSDPHWKQDSIEDIAKALVTSMGTSYIPVEGEWKQYPSFYGAYYGQLGMNLQPDVLSYFDSSIFDQLSIYDLELQKNIRVNNEEKLESYDPYEIFLSGSKPFLTITNPNGTQLKELVIFRDSFASPLIPFMVSSYSSITVIDLRYIHPDVIKDYLTYSNQDVLFLYSTLMINQSSSIK